MTSLYLIHMIFIYSSCDRVHILLIMEVITLLGEGMKALRAHNVVHRDIKPGNILIKYHPKTGKMMVNFNNMWAELCLILDQIS